MKRIETVTADSRAATIATREAMYSGNAQPLLRNAKQHTQVVACFDPMVY